MQLGLPQPIKNGLKCESADILLRVNLKIELLNSQTLNAYKI